MKICIISRSFPPHICGVGDYVYFLSKSLKESEHQVFVITSKTTDQKCAVYLCPVGEKWNVPGIFEIMGILETIKPDIVNIQYVCQLYGRAGIAPGIVLLPIFIKLRAHSKILITFHELYISWSSRDFILGAIQRLQAFILVLISNAVIVTTHTRKKTLDFLFPWKRIYEIPVGSNIPSYPDIKPHLAGIQQKAELSSNQVNKLTNQHTNKLILGTFGMLHPERDLATVFKAVSMLTVMSKNRSPITDYQLLLIGQIDRKSSEYLALRNLAKDLGIEDKIKWFDSIPAREVRNYLMHSDIYLSPQIDGPSGRRGTLMAALSCGLPVIAYDGNDRENMFKSYENIILVPPRNPEILAQKIKELGKNLKLRRDIGEKAYKTFEKYFSWEIIGKKYEQFFLEL